MRMKETNLVDEAFICLDELVVHRFIMWRKWGERVHHVVDAEEYGEQAIGSGPRDCAVFSVSGQKFMFNLVFKALHTRSQGRRDNRVVNRGSTVG